MNQVESILHQALGFGPGQDTEEAVKEAALVGGEESTLRLAWTYLQYAGYRTRK